MASSEEKPCWFNDKLPPPVSTDYTQVGTWQEIGGLKAYTSGPHTSSKAVVLIYDIFGVTSQVLQGADRMAQHLDALVVMPDFMKGNALNHDDFEADKAGYMAKMKPVMAQYSDIPTNVQALLDLIPELQKSYPTVKSWGAFGLCWGGKVAVVASNAENSPLKASGQAHPGRLAVEDVQALTIPHICMPSKDEPADIVAEYEKILAEKKLGKVERFDSMFHGWMGARANLADEENAQEYQRGYAMAADFFAKHL